MNPKEVAEWLINEDGNGASDEEFAETIVYMQRIFKGNKEDIKTAEDMTKIDTKEFSIWIKDCLDEIIFGTECNISAWWKKEKNNL